MGENTTVSFISFLLCNQHTPEGIIVSLDFTASLIQVCLYSMEPGDLTLDQLG